MSLEALDAIALAEEKARQIRAAAEQEAGKLLQQAQAAGDIAVTAARARAESEVKELMRRADEKAREDAQVLASNTRNRRAAMKARADKKTEDAVALVMERIVKG